MIIVIPMENSIKVPYNEHMHYEHENWKSELAFWKNDIRSFTNRLSTMVTRWPKEEVVKDLEYFQSEFVIFGAKIDDFEEAIEDHEANMADHGQLENRALHIALTKQHAAYRMKMEKQRQKYTDLKKDFFRFLSKNS